MTSYIGKAESSFRLVWNVDLLAFRILLSYHCITTARVLAVVQARGIAGVTGILGGEDFTYLRHNSEWLDNLEGKYRPCRNGVKASILLPEAPWSRVLLMSSCFVASEQRHDYLNAE